MAAIQHPIYEAPFDAVASSYDDTFTTSKIGRAQRASVWRELEETFQAGDRVLEIGCGTGVDACFLAERGVRVIASDSSPQMIAVTQRRIEKSGLQQFVRPLLLRAEALNELPSGELLDGAFSNFGALNCVEDLPRLAGDLAQRLKPGATALLVWMGPFCLWEVAWYLVRGNRDKAFRRLKRGGVTARIGDGASVHVRYPTRRMIEQAFAPEFQLMSLKGIGVAVPPSYVEPWAQHHPGLFRLCAQADSWMGRCPGLRLLADHLLVRLERHGATREL